MTERDRPVAGRPAARPSFAVAGVVAAAFVVAAALALPDSPWRLAPAAWIRLPLEAAVLGLVLALTPARALQRVAGLAGVLLAVLVVLKAADLASGQAIGRRFDPVLDAPLLAAAWNVLSGAIGRAGAALAVALALVLAGLTGAAAVLALRRLARTIAGTVPRRAATAALSAGLLLAGAAVGPPYADWRNAALLADHGRDSVASWRDLAAFDAEAAVDPSAAVPADRLLAGLRGHDVAVIFVESYGRSALEDPRYAGPVRAVLDRGDAALSAAGIGVRSAWLTSTTMGGMSWLAHATLLSGLRIDGQGRYDRLMASRRVSLNRLFAKAGWRTVALEPAITREWPDARWFGYDAVYPAAGLGYRGRPFNWITMPDQFTLAALRRLELDRPDRPPVMAEMALISSHAPWTPVPELVPWDALGDGRIFDDQAVAGDPPAVVWKDPDRVRLQYRKAVEYSLATLVSYAETYTDDRLVLIVLGDHQPAPLVTGEGASRDVPVHIVARDPAVLKAVAGWGWTAGFAPRDGAPVWPMAALRDRLVATFSDPAP